MAVFLLSIKVDWIVLKKAHALNNLVLLRNSAISSIQLPQSCLNRIIGMGLRVFTSMEGQNYLENRTLRPRERFENLTQVEYNASDTKHHYGLRMVSNTYEPLIRFHNLLTCLCLIEMVSNTVPVNRESNPYSNTI